MIRDILVSLVHDGKEKDPAAAYAVALAEMLQAHVTGIAFQIDPALRPSAFGMFPNRVLEAAVHEGKLAAERGAKSFREMSRLAGVAHECLTPTATLVESAEMFGRLARRYDLSVVRQAKPEIGATEDVLIEAALFDSGRPVVVVPYIQTLAPVFDRVACCWDGSRSAARAIADALPLLQRAKAIDVVVVKNDSSKSGEIEGADIATHLARHGLQVTAAVAGRSDVDVGNTILNYVADHSIDFLVMGGFGHSRLREFVLGGVTHTMMTSMTVPVLMSH